MGIQKNLFSEIVQSVRGSWVCINVILVFVFVVFCDVYLSRIYRIFHVRVHIFPPLLVNQVLQWHISLYHLTALSWSLNNNRFLSHSLTPSLSLSLSLSQSLNLFLSIQVQELFGERHKVPDHEPHIDITRHGERPDVKDFINRPRIEHSSVQEKMEAAAASSSSAS